MGANGSAIFSTALDGAAETECVSAAGGKRGDLLAVDGDQLCVVAGGIVKLVYWTVSLAHCCG